LLSDTPAYPKTIRAGVSHINHTTALKDKCKQIRRDILQASYEAKACHLGSAMSCVEILVDLFYKVLQKEDRFIFSKASGASTYYAILCDLGYFPKEKLAHYLKYFPEVSADVPGVIWSGGSVGHGLAVATGLAHADRSRNVYCLISDGEVDEGTTHESALFAGQHKLTNLYVICDNNGIQACGRTEDILDIKTALWFLRDTLPNFEIINTIKGKGVSFMENDFTWHYKNLTETQLSQALAENA
jgi:transketolase